MTNEISYKDLPKFLNKIRKGGGSPVYLFYGDEYLCESAFKSLLDVLVSARHKGINYAAVDGTRENVYKTIERLNTFPLIPAPNVIAVHGTRVFYSTVGVDDFLHKSKEAFERQDLKDSARYLLHMLGVAGMSINDVEEGAWKRISDKKLMESLKKHAAEAWLDQVITYCVQEKMTVPVHHDDAEVLNDAILKGFPEANRLVLTSDFVDKRRKLFKTINKIGVVIDCSIPKGDRASDKRRQQEALKARMREILGTTGKTMASGGFEALYEKTGPDTRGFCNELEKLITFVADRKEILPSDIEMVSKRTKEDPIYEMTNAVGERNTPKALFFLDSLLKNNFFPLQVLSAATNQIRKLILAKDFIRGRHGSGWKRDQSYAAFQKMTLPGLENREPDLLTNNAHPFAIYMTLKQSDNYTLEELIEALEVLLDTDIRLKSSGQDAKIVLEHAILRIHNPQSEGGQPQPSAYSSL